MPKNKEWSIDQEQKEIVYENIKSETTLEKSGRLLKGT